MKKRLWTLLCAVLVFATLLMQGCGKQSAEDKLKNMKEFSTPDGSASLYLNKNWESSGVGDIDCWMLAASNSGNDAVLLMQFPRRGANRMAESMEDVREIVELSYAVAEMKEAEAADVPGMTDVEAYRCNTNVDNKVFQAYLVYGETDYAYYALAYFREKLTDDIIETFHVSCSKFREEVPEVEDGFASEMTDTIRWFNASYAILTEINSWDYNLFGGLPVNDQSAETVQVLLDDWWGVTDRASADETLEWILEEGHRLAFAEDMETIEYAGMPKNATEKERVTFLSENFDLYEDEIQMYSDLYAMYEQYGAGAIDGWDYCRALNLLGYYYTAGYYTEQEALDQSLAIAKTVQSLFHSWDELVDSYLRGYDYWNGEGSEARRAIYESLKTRNDNPYQIDFNMTLEKTW